MNGLQRKFRRRLGFTLLEIVLAMAISSFVLLSIYGFLLAGNKTYVNGTNQYDVQSELRMVSDYMVKSTRFATTLNLISSLPSPLDPDYSYMYIDGGYLFHYVADNAGGSHTLRKFGGGIDSYAFSGSTSGQKAILNILLNKSSGGQEYSISDNTELPNLSLKNETIPTSGTVIVFSTSMDHAYSGPTNPTTAPTSPSTISTTTSSTTTAPPVVSVEFYTNDGDFNLSKIRLFSTSPVYNQEQVLSGGNTKTCTFINISVNSTYSYEFIKKVQGNWVTLLTGNLNVETVDVRKLLDW